MARIVLITVLSALLYLLNSVFSYASNEAPDDEAADIGDFLNISVYSIVQVKDSISFAARSAIYDPMNGSVMVNGTFYDIEPNDVSTEDDDPTIAYCFKAGDYYTNLD